MGYERQLFPRPELHHMLLSKVPVEKIHFSSKVSFFEQSQDSVIVTFENNTTARGDILIGADGARSSVRQHLYKTLDKEGLLPKSDNQDMKRGFISLLGTTSVLDPAKYPDVLKEDCQSYGIVGDGGNPYTVSGIAASFKCQKRVQYTPQKRIYSTTSFVDIARFISGQPLPCRATGFAGMLSFSWE